MISLLALLPIFSSAQTPATSCINCGYATAAGIPENVVSKTWDEAVARVVQIVGDKTLRGFYAKNASQIFKNKGLNYGGTPNFSATDDTNDLKIIFNHVRKVPADTAKYNVFVRPKTVGVSCTFRTLTKSGTGFFHGDFITREAYPGEWEFGIAGVVMGSTRCGNEELSEGVVIKPKDVSTVTGPIVTPPKDVTPAKPTVLPSPGLGVAKTNTTPTSTVTDGETHIHIHMDGDDDDDDKDAVVTTGFDNQTYGTSKWCPRCHKKWRRCFCGIVSTQLQLCGGCGLRLGLYHCSGGFGLNVGFGNSYHRYLPRNTLGYQTHQGRPWGIPEAVFVQPSNPVCGQSWQQTGPGYADFVRYGQTGWQPAVYKYQ